MKKEKLKLTEIVFFAVFTILKAFATFVLWFPLFYFYIKTGLIEHSPLAHNMIGVGLIVIAIVVYRFVSTTLYTQLDAMIEFKGKKLVG